MKDIIKIRRKERKDGNRKSKMCRKEIREQRTRGANWNIDCATACNRMLASHHFYENTERLSDEASHCTWEKLDTGSLSPDPKMEGVWRLQVMGGSQEDRVLIAVLTWLNYFNQSAVFQFSLMKDTLTCYIPEFLCQTIGAFIYGCSCCLLKNLCRILTSCSHNLERLFFSHYNPIMARVTFAVSSDAPFSTYCIEMWWGPASGAQGNHVIDVIM